MNTRVTWTLEPQPLSLPPASMTPSVLGPDTDVVTYIERLLNTIDRLRGERDSLSRDVEFLESESRFTIEALEAKLSASVSTESDKTVATITQLKIEMDEKERLLQDVESERDSLRLQITNLMTDMQDIQEELNNAEGRYTTLQFHQLSNMTNSEATRNLRGQIEELENRVMRRTEQIGIHQHDIKRLETNLRLQEERLAEMTTELEMMAAQKDAMVEDCADAREARDGALIRVDRLEEELESSDGRNVKRLETDLRLQEERLAELTTELETMAAQKHAMVEDCAAAREARDDALIRVERLEEELESSDGQNIENTVIVESLIATIAQTVCQARETIRLSREEYISAQNAQQRTIQGANSSNLELEQQLGAATDKLAELELLREQYNDLKKEHANQQSRLQEELTRTSHSYQDLGRSRDALQDENVRLTEDLIRIQKEHSTQIDRCREENLAIERKLKQQVTSLQGQIEEQHLGAATEKLAELELLREQYNDLKNEHAKQQSRLQEELATMSHYYQDLERSRDALQDENVRITEDLTCIQKEHATHIDRCREENRAIVQELEQQVTSLQGQIEEQGRLLNISEKEATRIRDRLQEEVEGRAQDQKQHAMALSSEKERNQDADETISQLSEELESLEKDLQQTNVHLQTVEDENLIVRQQMTELEAEVQRSKSLTNYLEIQLKDR